MFPVSQLVHETGISDVTSVHLAKEKQYLKENLCQATEKNPDQWTPENQLAVIIETAALNEAEMAEYCRKKGLFAEQIQQWKAAFISGVSGQACRFIRAA